jgi:hypothetical protein
LRAFSCAARYDGGHVANYEPLSLVTALPGDCEPVMKLRIQFCHRRFLASLGVAALAICVLPELEAKPQTADKSRNSALLSFISIPDKILPEHVRIRKTVRTAAIHNPAIITDRHQLSFMANFYGVVDDEEELKSIVVGTVAIYEDDTTEREIGIWGIYYSDQKSADQRFNKLLRLRKKVEDRGSVFPFIQQDRLLLFAWNDSSVSDHDFKAMLKYLETKKFNHRD